MTRKSRFSNLHDEKIAGFLEGTTGWLLWEENEFLDRFVRNRCTIIAFAY
jgi:hypothetical protein